MTARGRRRIGESRSQKIGWRGDYTLFLLHDAKDTWQLIVNSQTGQWGTDYHADKDFARFDMKTETLPQPVEVFTIAVEPQGDRTGVLKLQWDRTQMSLPFNVQ